MRSSRIFAFHLLNDLSGSPKVLSQLIKGWVGLDYDVHLYTGQHQQGFLSNLQGITYHNGWYRFAANPWLRLVFYSVSQFILFFKMIRKTKKTDVIYINTVLPFGAAILGKCRGCRVIYHIHESTVSPAVLKWFLFGIVKITASDIINVSKYVQQAHGIDTIPNYILYNAIENSFLKRVVDKNFPQNPSNILMVCSLKAYKGIFEFINLAQDNLSYKFRLVLNASPKEIEAFLGSDLRPENLAIYASQIDLHPFYNWADIIVNLSRPDGWIETFGLTIIEGMTYGLPAIVPPVGGILEVIEEGRTGYSVDSRDRNKLNHILGKMLSNPQLYKAFSIAAKERLSLFSESVFIEKSHFILKANPNYQQ